MERIAQQLKNPFAGLSQLLERANLSGIDTAGIVEARRKDIEAILEANRIVYAGAQALAHKQLEILRAAMSTARGAISQGTFAGSPIEIANRQRELMARAFQVSLAHMRELAEIVRKAQTDAFAVVKGQVERDVRELVGRVQGKRGARAGAPAAKRKAARKAKAAPKRRRAAKGAAAAAPKAAPAAKRAARARTAKRTAKRTARKTAKSAKSPAKTATKPAAKVSARRAARKAP
jgi:phasin family protein